MSIGLIVIYMSISLMQSVSSNGDLIFTIEGDLPEKSYRGEGRFVVDLLNQHCVIENNPNYFSNGFDLSNGRGLLAALFIFHPTWNAIGSYKETTSLSSGKNHMC